MNFLGQDFALAMRQLTQTLARAESTLDAAEATVIELHQTITKLNALLERIQIKP